MKYTKQAWDQIKGKTCDEIIAGLRKDGWAERSSFGSEITFKKTYPNNDIRRVNIHYHSGQTYGANLMKCLLAEIGWSEPDMKQLKFIK